jgi:hypothetical protein
MHTDQLPYRRLYDDVLSYDGDALFADLLRPWLAAEDGERRWLDALRARPGQPIPPMSQEELWRLYALSRIVQLLQLSFQPRRGDFGPTIATVTADEYTAFLDALGLEMVDEADFHPFHHEVVTVDELPYLDSPPSIAEILWPGCRLGPLLISRAGCRVRAGRHHLAKEIAENSTLYWAAARANRPAEDLGSGWGSNSQWRTSFRRDYALDGAFYYNVDACTPRPGSTLEDDLDATERDELLRHRCFVTSTRPGEDRWPYDLTLIECT